MSYHTTATEARKKILELIYKAQTSHIGSNFSCVDLMTVLFDKIDLDKDKFILSAGWKAAALYYFLWKKGRITEEQLNSYCQEGSEFIGLAEPIHPDIPFAGGSMCMGIAAGVGFALAKKLKNEEGTIYVLESDGALQGGITWEAALIASRFRLNNLIVIVDYNQFQAMGRITKILPIEPLVDKWLSFGWKVMDINGHDFDSIKLIWEEDINGIYVPGAGAMPLGAVGMMPSIRDETLKFKPLVVIANTIKGKGIPKWENNNLWHYSQIKEDDYKYALSCLKHA